MVWISWAGPVSHLISDMGGAFEGELGEFMEAHGIRQYFTASEAPWQNGLVEPNGGTWKATARKNNQRCRSTRFRGNAKTRLHGELGKKKRSCITSSGYSPDQWVIGRGYKLPRSLLDEKQSGELASLKLPDHSPEFGRRMSGLWAARRAFETMDTSPPFETRVVGRGSSKYSHPGDSDW